ncbi:MAG: hypothetical protein ACTSPM_13555 [Candidatus Heimdallarchaeota archaeon]
MGKKAITCLLIVGIVISNLTMKVSSLPNPDYIIDDFSGFSNFHDTNLVTSTIEESEINMVHNNELGEYAWETFFNGFGEIDDYYDFNLDLSLNYAYTGSMLMQLSLMLGSYYFENGTYDEETPTNYRNICTCGIWDAWSSSGGKYYVNARPYEIKDQYETSYGSLAPSGTIQFKISRLNNTLNLSIIKEGSIQIQHQWSAGVAKPLSYIYIAMSIDPDYCSYTEITFTSLLAKLYTKNNNGPLFPHISIGITTNIICIIVMLSLGTIFGYRKKRKHQLK